MRVIENDYSNGITVRLADYYPEFADNGWYEHGEPETQQWIVDNVKPNWVCFDCGAHVGLYTILLGFITYEHIVAFEPCEQTIQKLMKNLYHNYNYTESSETFSNISVVKCALGNQVGMFEETVWQTGVTSGNFGKTTAVFPFLSIDFYTLVHRTNVLNLIKIDCDGWDYDILLGAKNTLVKLKPFVIVEANYALEWRGHKPEEIIDYAKSIGYTYEWLDKGCPGNLLLKPKEK